MSSYLLRKSHPSEDAFTGMLADLMAWWPDEALDLLRGARSFDDDLLRADGIAAGHRGHLEVTAWPPWPSGEPDLVLEFCSEAGRSMVIIEAKLGAPKSSSDDPACDGAAAGETRDQLAKYFHDAVAARDRRGSPIPLRVDVVYLTHHTFAPVEDLRESRRAMGAGRSPVAGDLYWLSWSHVEQAIRVALASAAGGRARALESVGSVLRQEGFERFSGAWSHDRATALEMPPQWFVHYWWRAPRRVRTPPEGPVFWRFE